MTLHKNPKRFFNEIRIENNFSYCIFSSRKSVDLITEQIEEEERFFLMDGTFRITPRGVFKQVLIIHLQYKKKVCESININILIKYY